MSRSHLAVAPKAAGEPCKLCGAEQLIAQPFCVLCGRHSDAGSSVARDQCKLAAILTADVVGYSRMMGRDQSDTLALLREHRKARLEPVLTRYAGPAQPECVSRRVTCSGDHACRVIAFPFPTLLRILVPRLRTMPHLLSFFQFPD
jgi:hypothetical protein